MGPRDPRFPSVPPMRRTGQGSSVRHNGHEIREALKEILALEHPPKETLGARWVIRQTIEYINHLEAELRRAGFAEYDKENKENV